MKSVQKYSFKKNEFYRKNTLEKRNCKMYFIVLFIHFYLKQTEVLNFKNEI